MLLVAGLDKTFSNEVTKLSTRQIKVTEPPTDWENRIRTQLCGQVKVNVAPTNRGEDRVNDGDANSYDDMDDDQHLEKMFGGSYVTYGEIPWQVSIHVEGQFNCGGAILNAFWVITTAACVK
ncbi:hypothetical protein BsWGS_19422 [Bradybaena similaris]